MRIVWGIFPMVLLSLLGVAHAEPLEEIKTSIIPAGDLLTIQISWNHDDTAESYMVGCISCHPNIIEHTPNDVIILEKVSTLQDGEAWLFVLAYDHLDRIIAGQQVVVDIS